MHICSEFLQKLDNIVSYFRYLRKYAFKKILTMYVKLKKKFSYILVKILSLDHINANDMHISFHI